MFLFAVPVEPAQQCVEPRPRLVGAALVVFGGLPVGPAFDALAELSSESVETDFPQLFHPPSIAKTAESVQWIG